MPSFTFFLQHLGLALRLTATYPALEPADALAHARAAIHAAAATDDISPELLLGIAYVDMMKGSLWSSIGSGNWRCLPAPATSPIWWRHITSCANR